MKINYLLFVLLISTSVFSQGEASNWYFGDYAGVSFSTGTPVALTNMPMVFGNNLSSEEGCTSISDSNGNLLFYTNGTKVWDRNHDIMFNGLDLHGNQSSSQSAIIVPKPGSDTNYYIFTVDEHNTNTYGLQYSEVDMTLNGGFGDLVSKNNPLLNHCTEKITAVKSVNCSEIWVMAYSSLNGLNVGNYNTFFSFKITDAGVQTNPIQSTVSVSNINDGRGYLKVSADGSKLAIAHQGLNANGLYLYNFNKQTGVVSDQVKLTMSDPSHPNNNLDTQPYGLEFSLSTNKLYVTSSTSDGKSYLWQFNLVNNTRKLISYQPNNSFRGALQMAPNSKIYRSLSINYDLGSKYLGVINNPEANDVACNYQHDAIDLDPNNEGRKSRQGLPPFIQSLFLNQIDIIAPDSVTLQTDLDLCIGDTYHLEGPVIPGATYNWYINGVLMVPYNLNYIDVTNNISANYKLEIDKNDGSCPTEGKANITFHPLPIVNPNTTLIQCDNDSDGITFFNLREKETEISSNSVNETFTFTYYTSFSGADNATAATLISTPTTYSSGNGTVWVRVSNPYCYRVSQLNLIVSATQLPSSFHPSLYKCDDFLDIDGNNNSNNNNSDGIASFDFSGVSASIAAILPIGTNYSIKYYKNGQDALAETNQITNITNYRNIGYPNQQQIYVRIDSEVDNACFGLGPYLTLNVESLPIANPIPAIASQCDDNHDGSYPFDSSSILPALLNGQTNVTVTYYDQNNVLIPTGLPNQLPNPFNTASQTIRIRVTNNTTSVATGPCYDETTLTFIVDEAPIANPVTINPVCDDEVDPANADGLIAFDTSTFESIILGTQTLTEMEVKYFDGNGNPLPSPLPNPFITGTQEVTVIVENRINPACNDTTSLHFVVNPRPNIEIKHTEIICSHEPTFSTTLDAAIQDGSPNTDYTYQWYFEDNLLNGETNQTLQNVVTEGVYSVDVTNAFNCNRVRTITVVHSSQAILQGPIVVADLIDNNTVSVYLTPNSLGNYVYSLDYPNVYQTANIFNNVSPGIHEVYIIDLNGCEIVSQTISVIGMPHFFTPNGDGFNNTWNVKGISFRFNYNSTINIFDRFGKLLKQIGTTSQGWDGTFDGQPMPSSDYWYAVYLEDGRIAKGHFTLKR